MLNKSYKDINIPQVIDNKIRIWITMGLNMEILPIYCSIS